MIGAVIGSSLIGASASSKAANAQKSAEDAQVALHKGIYDDTSAKMAPWLNSGTTANQAYAHELGLGDAPKDYGGYTKTPGYDFRLKEGMNALQASAAAKGGLNSGAAMKALMKYGQDYATGEYSTYMNRLAGMSDSGQAAAANLASAGQNYANGASNALSNYGNAAAAGYIGQANALTGGLQNMLGIYNYQKGISAASSPWTTGSTAGVGLW